MQSARDLIETKLYRYCELIDTGDLDGFADLFRHGTWVVTKDRAGTEPLLAWLQANVILYDGSPCTQHVTSNLVLDIDEQAGLASARSYVTIFQARPGLPLQPIVAGRYFDEFRRVDDDWQWRSRDFQPLAFGDTSHHMRRADGVRSHFASNTAGSRA